MPLVVERRSALQLNLSDYVFDGTSPPYTPSASMNPVQLYGQTKHDGEVAVLGVDGAKAVVLRVPVLYVFIGSLIPLFRPYPNFKSL
jgi:dTDP-4-dehydrorhamnose reductase